jgi:hypothetical protein
MMKSGTPKKSGEHKKSGAVSVGKTSVSPGALNNAEILEKLSGVYRSINANWRYPSDATVPVGQTSSWISLDMEWKLGRTSMVAWNAGKQRLFSSALEEITNSSLVMECSNAGRIARLALTSYVIGDEGMRQGFNQFAKAYPAYDAKAAALVTHSLSWAFFDRVENDLDRGKFYAYGFANIPEYSHFKGSSDPNYNHNVVRLPDGTFLGFDPEFFTGPRTYDELSQFMYQRFIDPSGVKPGMEQEHRDFSQQLSYEEFEKKRRALQDQVGYFAFNPNKGDQRSARGTKKQ